MHILEKIINRILEWSFKRTARKQFDKAQIKYRDGDNT